MQRAAEHAAARIAVSRNFCTLLEEADQDALQYIPNILPSKFTAPAGRKPPGTDNPFHFFAPLPIYRATKATIC